MWPSNIFYVETFSLWEELLFFIICIYLQRRTVLPSLSMEAKPSHSPFMSLPSNKFRIESKKCLYLLTSVIDGGSDLSFKHKTLIVNRVMETCRFFPSIYPKISQKRKWIAFMIYDGKQKRTENDQWLNGWAWVLHSFIMLEKHFFQNRKPVLRRELLVICSSTPGPGSASCACVPCRAVTLMSGSRFSHGF